MIFKDEDLNIKLKEIFDDYFRNSKYYTGENCSPKYETYRVIYQGWVQGFLSMLRLVGSETYYNDYIDLCFYEHSLCEDFLDAELSDSFKINKN